MLHHFIEFVLKQRMLILLFGFLSLIFGIISWQNLSTDAFPDVTNVQVMILTQSPGLAPLEVERLVTSRIELKMKGLPQVSQVRSLSKAGLSQVVIIFDDDVDIYFARQIILERILQAKEELPEGLEPEMGPISTGLGEIYQYVVKPGFYCLEHPDNWYEEETTCARCLKPLQKIEYSLRDLRTIQDWIIAPQLRKLRGVNEVNSFGGFVKEYHILPDPNLLIKYKVSLEEVLEAVEKNNSNRGGNYLVRGGEQLYIVGKGLFQKIDDIKKIVLKSEDGTPVYLHEIADVIIGDSPRQGAVTQDGKGEVVAGMVVMLRGANSRQVVNLVKQEIPKIQAMLPPGVRIIPFYDRTMLIQNCFRTVTSALIQGVLFVILILFILLWDFRVALTVTLSLPITASITFIAMRWAGLTADMMSLGGLAIALGAVVDASIVVADNVVRHYTEKSTPQDNRMEVSYRAISEVAMPIIFAILIIVIVFVPLFTLESLEKKMFQPLALTICFAMAASLVVSLTVIAAVASIVTKQNQRKNIVEDWLLRIYQPILNKLLNRPRIAYIIVPILIVAMILPFPFLGTEFMPPLDEGAIAVNMVRLSSASLDFSKEQSTYLEKILLEKFSEIETIVSKSGRAEIAEDPMGPEQTDIIFTLKPYHLWKSKRTKEQLTEEIRLEMLKIPGIKPAFSQPIALRVNELISGVKSDIAIKIFGDDLETLKNISEQVSNVLNKVHGAMDIKIEQISGFSQIEIEVNREEMGRHKINGDEIGLIIEAAIGGKTVTKFLEGEQTFSVVVRYPEIYRRNKESIENILVHSPLGYSVPLGKITNINEIEVPAQISREDGQRRLLVECNILGRDMGGFIKEVQELLEPVEKSLPTGYHLVWGGQFENQRRAMSKLSIAVPLAIFIIALILYSEYRSLKSTIMVLFNLPFAVLGGLWMLWLFNINISVSAIIGFIALLGMAIEDGTVLVSFFQELRSQGMTLRQSILEGTRLRLRPILCTSLTTLLGLFPMLYASGPGAEIQRPLAIVIIGGLFSALLLVLFLFPLLYFLLHQEK